MKKNLDFIVIGAMRSGTTTLHELLKQHPQIALPPGKEVPFFCDDEEYGKGLDWYLEKNFKHATNKQTWGTITPQYMYSPNGVPTEKTAERIKKHMPDIKLIAILRHPVKRAFSNYQLVKRRNLDDRTFSDAVKEILASDESELREKSDAHNIYLLRSKYGEQLDIYYKLFSADQILVLFTDELEKYPAETLRRILSFIGVDSSFKPEGLGQTFHKGGGKAKIGFLTPGRLGKIQPLRAVYRKVVPYRQRKRFEMWLHVWNTKPDNNKLDPGSQLYKDLVSFFENDVKHQESLTGRKVPWPDWEE